MDNYKNPRITVLMPTYNCELYIQEAVESILNQTFSDFEFLIIDDCSTDATLEICKSFTDERIVIIEKEKKSGYTISLNYGLSIARGEYIARMDGDDISFPKRFEKQITFLEANPDVIVCGSLYSVIGTNEIVNFPETHELIKLGLLRKCCIAHPTVMLRKKVLDEHKIIYDVSEEPAEDYALWVCLASIGKLHNLQDALLDYRLHSMQVSQKRAVQQAKKANDIKFSLLNSLDFIAEAEEKQILKQIIKNTRTFAFDEIKLFQSIKDKLIYANRDGFFDRDGFNECLIGIENTLLKNYFIKRVTYSPLIYFQYLQVKKRWKYKLVSFDEFKLFIKAIVFYKKK